MRKLKYSHKINKETAALTEIIDNYVKKMNKEYVGNMNKLIELIARGENLDVNKLKTKYLGFFKSSPDSDNSEDIKNEDTEQEITNITVSDEIYLDKVLIDSLEYWYEKKNKGIIYYKNNIVGSYNNNIFEINGKKYNNKLELID